MAKQIYFYSDTDRYEDQIKLGKLPKLKIGDTEREQVDVRIKEQRNESCPLVLDKKGSYFTPFGDREFHQYLTTVGYDRVSNDREWFYITVEDAEKEIFNYKNGVVKINKYYQARPHQAWVNAVILDRWDSKSTMIQPANLCARFGKTLQGLDLFYQSNLNVMIVCSYWLGANESFIDETNQKFDITGDVVVIKPSYDEFLKHIDSGKRIVIDVSLHVDSDAIDERLIKELGGYQSLIYVDEADYGAWRETQRDKLQTYINTNNNLVVIATGSNIERALIGSSQEIEELIEVHYMDMIDCRDGEGFLLDKSYTGAGELERSLINNIRKEEGKWRERLSDLVDISCVNVQFNPDIALDTNILDEEKRPNMRKICSGYNNSSLVNVIRDIEGVFDLYDEFVLPVNPAIMVFIPGEKKSIDNFVNRGNSIFKNDGVEFIALHTSNKFTGRTAQKIIKEHIANSDADRFVIVSCGLGARSFTIPNIISVVNCVDGGSSGISLQRNSRCLSPGLGKMMGLIVNYSFNTNRICSFQADLLSTATDKAEDYTSALRRVYRIARFYTVDKYGYLSKMEFDNFSAYASSNANLKSMASAVIDYDSILAGIDYDGILANIKDYKSKASTEWESAFSKAKTYISNNTPTERNSKDDELVKLKKKIQRVVDTSGNVYYLSIDSTGFADALKHISLDFDADYAYTKLVGVGAGFILDHILPYLPIKLLDMIFVGSMHHDSYSNFGSADGDHVSGLFNDII